MKVKAPTIFLPIEITNRELDYKLNLGRYFCKAGFEVILGNPPFIRDELKYKNYKGIFLEKGAMPDPEYYELLKDKGILLYDLTDEGLGDCIYSLGFPKLVKALKHMQKIFLWGKTQAQDLKKISPDVELSKKFHVIGNPALDLCFAKYRKVYQLLRPKYFPAKYILVNTNFSGYNGHKPGELLKACPNMDPKSYERILEGCALEEKEFFIFKAWLDDIITGFPNETFLIRPHPTELQEKYEQLFSKYPNVYINKECSINQVIASAKIVLHKDSSTSLQSYLMGVPVLALGGSAIKRLTYMWPFNFCWSPETLEETKKIMQIILTKGMWEKDMQEKIDIKARKAFKNYFCNIGYSTSQLAADIIKDANKKLVINESYKLIDSRTVIQKVKMFIRKLLPLHYKVSKASRETLIEFDKKEVEQKLELFESVEPLNLVLQVKKIFPNTFRISTR